MALVITIAGVDRTAIVEHDSIRITQLAASFTFTAELRIFDEDADVSITAGSHLAADEITIVDGATTFFGGFIANQDISSAGGGSRHLNLQCQGYGILLNEVYVEYEEYTGDSDADVIDDLFTTYLSTIDSTTEVATIVDPLDILFTEMTLAEVMEAICQRTGARYYIDNDKVLHYFADEGNDAGFDLSDEPNDVTSFAYFNDPEKREDASAIVNRVRVIGADNFAVVRNDAASQASYGIRAAIVTDQSLDTTAEMEERGDAVLDKHKDPRVTFRVRTYHDGAVAGNEIDFKCDLLGYNSISNGDDPLVIREMNISWQAGDPVYEMLLGEAEVTAITRAAYMGEIIRQIIVDPGIPIASRGWAHDLVFSATDQNTVAWEAGTITLAGGVGSFSIDAGNTGDIADITYIYLDIATSLTVLQTTGSAANAVGGGKIMVAACAPSGEAGKDAPFQVFGGEGGGVVIMADNILADSVDTNELVANSVTTAILDTYAVTAAKIAAAAVDATKLNIGEQLFNVADGLLLLGPPLHIDPGDDDTPTDSLWHSTRGSVATIEGCLHLEQGRWQGTRGIVVEKSATNKFSNPSFEHDTWDTDWTEAGTNPPTTADETTEVYLGKHAAKVTFGGANSLFVENMIADKATLDGVAMTLSVWVKTTATDVKAYFYANNATGTGTSSAHPGDGQWHRLSLSFTPAFDQGGATTLIYFGVQGATAATIAYCDCFMLDTSTNNDHLTSYLDGDQGIYCEWTGDPNESPSQRAQTNLYHDADPWLPVLSSDAGALLIWFQMPTASGSLDDSYARIFEFGNYSNPVTADWFAAIFDDDGDSVTVGIRRLSDTSAKNDSFAVSYAAGDWLCLALAWDSSSLKIYWQGEEVGEISSPNFYADYDFTTFNLLHAGNSEFTNGTLGLFATWTRKLTATEVAYLYQLKEPLIDLGPVDRPGVYIYDGKFKIASNTSGNRIEITPDEISGYDRDGTKQFYLRAEDGKALAGAGAIYLDEGGTSIVVSTSEADLRAYKFVLTEDGTVLSGLFAFAPDAWTNTLNLRAKSIASRSSTINVLSDSPATYPAYVSIKAGSSANFAQILLTADSDAATKERIDFYADLFNFGIAAVPASAVSVDGYIPLYFNGTLRKVFYGTFS